MSTINDLTALTGANAATTDELAIWDADASTTKKITLAEFAKATQAFTDNTFSLIDNSDNTKVAKFELSGLTTATTRTFTLPDANTTVVGTATTQTLTNKTIDPASNTIDGDKLDITYTPTNYTPATTPTEADDVDDLAAHLYGIDQQLADNAARFVEAPVIYSSATTTANPYDAVEDSGTIVRGAEISNTQYVNFSITVPSFATSITNLYVVVIPQATNAAVSYTVDTNYGRLGQDIAIHTGTISTTFNAVGDTYSYIDITSAVSDAAASDTIAVKFTNAESGFNMNVVKIMMVYSVA